MNNLQEAGSEQKVKCEKCGRLMHKARGCLYCGTAIARAPTAANGQKAQKSGSYSDFIADLAKAKLIDPQKINLAKSVPESQISSIDDSSDEASESGIDLLLLLLSLPVLVPAMVLRGMESKGRWFRPRKKTSTPVLMAYSLLVGVFACSLQLHWGTKSPPPFIAIYFVSLVSLWIRQFRKR